MNISDFIYNKKDRDTVDFFIYVLYNKMGYDRFIIFIKYYIGIHRFFYNSK